VSDLAGIRELAEALARQAGALQRERYETQLSMESKSVPIDLVTEVDLACERLIVEAISRARSTPSTAP
jgi:fructose-1,6-bisphosphatase/inositol monophosphatase family enzyme